LSNGALRNQRSLFARDSDKKGIQEIAFFEIQFDFKLIIFSIYLNALKRKSQQNRALDKEAENLLLNLPFGPFPRNE
jgi:hypothetical protein